VGKSITNKQFLSKNMFLCAFGAEPDR